MAFKELCLVLFVCTLARAAPTPEPQKPSEPTENGKDVIMMSYTVVMEPGAALQQQLDMINKLLKEGGLTLQQQMDMLNKLLKEEVLKSNAGTPAPKLQETVEVTEDHKDSPIYSSPSPPIDDQVVID